MTHLADLTTNSQRYYIVSYIVTSFLMWFICVVNVVSCIYFQYVSQSLAISMCPLRFSILSLLQGLSIASALSQNISRSLTASKYFICN